jgi:trk system potassium uptake protein TrkA
MHIVIGGYGRVGKQMARSLTEHGHTVAVIDHSPASFGASDDVFRGQRLVGEVFDRETLELAGIEKADCFAAVTSGDNSNVVSARIARLRYEVPNVLARIYDPRRAELYRELGIHTISSVEWASAQLLAMIASPELQSGYQFGAGEVELFEVDAPRSLFGARLPAFEIPGEIRVAAVVRDHRAIVPAPGLTVEPGDRLYVSVLHESVSKFESMLDKEAR